MYNFVNDYSESAHPAVLAAIAATATSQDGQPVPQFSGYSLDDPRCKHAAAMIREHIGKTEAEVDIHFFVGGTQTNLVTITGILRPWEAVISVHTGHIYVQETGAIEARGHKVLTATAEDGKLTPELVQGLLDAHASEHMVVPRLVYISNTTEIGTQYLKHELEALYHFCHSKGLLLYMDGARLGPALASSINDLTMKDVANLTDVFYMSGTKNGSLFGEALVISTPVLKPNFRHLIKQHGCLLAKGWLLGTQFEALFTDKLFYRCADHANRMAMILHDGVKECGYEFLAESFTNQQFVKFPAAVVEQLSRKFAMSHRYNLPNDMRVVRLCTSWATSEEQCHNFVKYLKSISGVN